MKKSLIVLLICHLSGPLMAESDLQVTGAYVRTAPPGQTVTAAFFKVENVSERRCSLTGAYSAQVGRVEMHQHQHVDGMMRMRPVDEVAVEPGGVVEFKPGGYHLMLFDVAVNLAETDSVLLELNTDSCGCFSVTAKVKDLRSN